MKRAQKRPAARDSGRPRDGSAERQIDHENTPSTSPAQSPFGAALNRWAERRGERLAEEYLRAAERGDAAKFFEAEIGHEKLLRSLRPSAEAAFLKRVATAEKAS